MKSEIIVASVLAAVGFLLMFVGGGTLGALLFFPAVIFIIIKSYLDKEKVKKIQQENAEKNRAATQAKFLERQAAVAEHKRLIEQYKNSPLMKDVMNTIRGEMPHNNPEEIVITNNYISGKNQGKSFTYDFAANGVYSFKAVYQTIDRIAEEKYIVRPQMAMAEALNCLFNNKYIIEDHAERQHYTNSSYEETHHWVTYKSNHVKMVLASTLPSKYF